MRTSLATRSRSRLLAPLAFCVALVACHTPKQQHPGGPESDGSSASLIAVPQTSARPTATGHAERNAHSDSAGPEMAADLTPAGVSPATVVTLTPTDAATGVERGTNIDADFGSALVRTSALAAFSVTVRGNSVPGQTTYDATNNKVTFNPTALLPAGSKVKVRLAAIARVDGGMTTEQNWEFTTKN